MPPVIDLSTPRGRFAAYWRLFWQDHAFLRLSYTNAYKVSEELTRANQPWPFQVKAWARRGIRTIVNLRVGDDAHHKLEREACERYGLKQVPFVVRATEAPSREQVLGAKQLFDEIEYPAMIHCKSGADRAGMMSVLYLHFRKGLPISQAVGQLALKYGHTKLGPEAVLDFYFEKYLKEIAPQGISYEDWVRSPDYDAPAITQAFRAQRWSALLKLLRRGE